MTYFEVKVRYTRYIADGKTEKAVYTALIQTLTFADAEAKALEQVENYAMAGCDIEVQAIKKVQYNALLLRQDGTQTGDSYYRAKVMQTVIDEMSGKEKQIAVLLLVEEKDVVSAHRRVLDDYKDAMVDFTIDDVVKTKINEVIQ